MIIERPDPEPSEGSTEGFTTAQRIEDLAVSCLGYTAG